MWVFTSSGFVSAVYKHEQVQIRARDQLSLEAIAECSGSGVISTPNADYPYRVITDKETFSRWLSNEVLQMTYRNYKSEAFSKRGVNFARPLHDVWETMHQVEDSDARNTSP